MGEGFIGPQISAIARGGAGPPIITERKGLIDVFSICMS